MTASHATPVDSTRRRHSCDAVRIQLPRMPRWLRKLGRAYAPQPGLPQRTDVCSLSNTTTVAVSSQASVLTR